MNRIELIIATAVILFVAFTLGWFANWFIHRFTRVSLSDISELERMSKELHDAEEERDQERKRFSQRETELSTELRQTKAELAAVMEALKSVREQT
ncbi:MAG: hypothetical protein OXE94_01645 [Aestuariivita sp.]|nr:hypothetical protein [Aestuariivita sp.]MCY4202925.1 hypothetical protein [Aestuariivita sp.]MCY4288020.1 hypothetical protein [Aestuariivita sp.]MCY4346617.1 hypothetical protein [Aestuariivita sp.]